MAGTIGLDALQLEIRCFGFSDVQPTDAYCDSVEWIANRGITLGCGSNHYCPDDTVTRAQMSLFV